MSADSASTPQDAEKPPSITGAFASAMCPPDENRITSLVWFPVRLIFVVFCGSLMLVCAGVGIVVKGAVGAGEEKGKSVVSSNPASGMSK
jgi:hypothetical protein